MVPVFILQLQSVIRWQEMTLQDHSCLSHFTVSYRMAKNYTTNKFLFISFYSQLTDDKKLHY